MIPGAANAKPAYPLKKTEDALKWYLTQGSFYQSMTRSFLLNAGIAKGMSVLDVGSGAGDVSILLADLVGSRGHVLGIDQSPEAIAASKDRVSRLGLANVEFIQEDIRMIAYESCFDAVVGRFILMYFAADASTVLAKLSTCLKADGSLIFIEPDYSSARTSENLPFCASIHELVERALSLSGADTQMGLKLFRVFLEAGLPLPRLQLSAAIGGGPDFVGYEVAAGFVNLLLPIIEKFDLAPGVDLAPATLEDRLRLEVTESGGVVVFPSLIAASSRRRAVDLQL